MEIKFGLYNIYGHQQRAAQNDISPSEKGFKLTTT